MESTMNENLDDENKKVWKGKQVHDEHVQDEQEKKEGNKCWHYDACVVLDGNPLQEEHLTYL